MQGGQFAANYDAEASAAADDSAAGDPHPLLKTLNRQQKAAVLHGDSPLLIVAGAGTGKTTTLAHRVAWQIIQGADPGSILLLTFTRRAASEMLRRVDAILRNPELEESSRFARTAASRSIHGGTFHSAATNLLRRYGQYIGLHPDFTILDRGDSEDLINLMRSQLKLPKSGSRFPLKATCLDIYSRCVNTQKPLDVVLKKWFPWCGDHEDRLAELFTLYVEIKEKQRVLDFDDLLLFWNALAASEEGGAVLRKKFRKVFVDEYQDTNVLQAEILRSLAPDGTGLTAVGDDAQSIYSFRAATIRNILDFPDHFPGTTLAPLEQNYRSTQPILDLTNRVIAESPERHPKELWSDRAEGPQPVLVTCQDDDAQNEYIVERILERREVGVPLKDQAVLFRASHHSMALEAELGRRNIPFHKYGGLKFLETAHVKDLLAHLRLAANPRDTVSGFRVLMLVPGVGHARASGLMEQLTVQEGDFTAWKDWKPPTAAQKDWPELVKLLTTLARRDERHDPDVSADVHAIRSYYGPRLDGHYDNVRARRNDLQQLESIAARYQTRAEFLSEMTLDPPTSTQELPADPWLDEDYLILSTIHSAKGLEWDSVFTIHAADGNIPADMATGSPEEVEEERRLFYVALTRAKNQLHVLRPERYYFHHRSRSDQHSLSKLTRFLTKDMLTLCNLQTQGDVLHADPMREPPADRSLLQSDTSEIRSRIAKLWSRD